MRTLLISIFSIATIVFGTLTFLVSKGFLWALVPILFLFGVLIKDILQSKHAILKNFPLIGRSRYIAEWLRPKFYQYFIEPDYDGRPFSRLDRSLIYQRAKKETDTTPFGTQLDVYAEGYEWISHSIIAKDPHTLPQQPRVLVGNKDCTQPYNLSLLNVSAMSFGSLSPAAVEALNGGAALGGFAHNTGEGGISPYHLKHGGDLIYQLGTGYFGSRNLDGSFSPELFAQKTNDPKIKMIEIKLSQGAKPGHGGILPAKKATPEIAAIRNIEPYKDVISPPAHKAFSTPIELVNFIAQLRKLSNGKPIGFKLCVGRKSEFIAICKAIVETGIKPDFITVDGGEGGTGAAPLEFSNHVGMPLKEGLAFVYDTLVGFNIKKDIVLIASGKVSSGFQILRNIALGADACNSARAMMMAVGCIQALECNLNTCPTGVATQDPELMKGLVVEDKKQRVFQFHDSTIKSFTDLLAAAGMTNPDELHRGHVHRRLSMYESRRYDEVFPYIAEGSLLNSESVPESWKSEWSIATAKSFVPRFDTVFVAED
jgi:glutamate synthase domain-containing protein 2